MIGNLFLALGLACLSASAVSTDNFKKVNTHNSITYRYISINSSDVVLTTYDDKEVYQCNEILFRVETDDVQSNDVIYYGVTNNYSKLYDTNSNLSFAEWINANNIKCGVMAIHTGEVLYLNFSGSTSLYSYDSDNVYEFANQYLRFSILQHEGGTTLGGVKPVTYDQYDTLGSYYNYSQVLNNQFYYLQNPNSDFWQPNQTIRYVYPYTFDFDVRDDEYTIRFNMFSFKDNTFSDGFSVGYSDGYRDGLSQGYSNGYAEGLAVGTSANADVKNLFGVLADTPIRFLKQMFNFELFGMNVAVVILSCLTAICMFALIKKIWK